MNWVLDADIRDFFGSLTHEWLVKFVEHRIGDKRVVRLIQKWLAAGVLEDGKRVRSEVGTVQGGSVSPLLANIYLHYVLDLWVQQWRKKQARGDMVIVRFADDFVVGFEHRQEAERFLAEIRERFAQFGLELHPDKTKIVYCKDANRRGNFEHTSFDFLGYTFRTRLAHGPRGYFRGFSPAISNGARTAVGHQIRAWHLNRRSGSDLSSLAEAINPQLRGWINYYGRFYRSELRFLAWRIDQHLARWAMHKFKRFRGKFRRAMQWLRKVHQHQHDLFAHWRLVRP